MNKYKLTILGISLLFYTQLQAQKVNFGVSINSIMDRNYNTPKGDFQFQPRDINLHSSIPLNIGINLEKTGNKIHPSIGVNLIQRNLVYSENDINMVTFSHQTIELPINFSYKKKISSENSFITNLGGGLSYILTPTNKTGVGLRSNDSLVYEFSILNPKKLNGFINAGFGIENNLGNLGVLQIKFQYIFQIIPMLQYNYSDKYFTQTTNAFRVNYAMVGLTYFPSFCRQRKTANRLN